MSAVVEADAAVHRLMKQWSQKEKVVMKKRQHERNNNEALGVKGAEALSFSKKHSRQQAKQLLKVGNVREKVSKRFKAWRKEVSDRLLYPCFLRMVICVHT